MPAPKAFPTFGRLPLPKPEWGTKRLCASCGARYYDMHRSEIVCPACGAPFDADGAKRSRRTAAAAAATPAAAIAEAVDLPEVEEEEEVVAEDEAVVVPAEEDDEEEEGLPLVEDVVLDGGEEEDEEGALIEDAAELGEDEDVADVIEGDIEDEEETP